MAALKLYKNFQNEKQEEMKKDNISNTITDETGKKPDVVIVYEAKKENKFLRNLFSIVTTIVVLGVLTTLIVLGVTYLPLISIK